MAVASTREDFLSAGQWLPYGAAALVNIAAILSAWTLYLIPAFPYLALALVLVGTPASMYLRAARVNRPLLNISIVGVSLAFIFAMLSRIELPSGGFLNIALSMEDRAAVALVIQMFITVAMFRSFSLLTDRDLTLTIIPALSTILLASVAAGSVWVVVSLLMFILGAVYLLAFDHQESWAGRAQAGRLLPQRRRRSLLATSAAGVWMVAVPITFTLAVAFSFLNLPRAVMAHYHNYLPYAITTWVMQRVLPAWIMPGQGITLGSGPPQRNHIVFRVESVESALWRATVADTYTGQGWSMSAEARRGEVLSLEGDTWVVPSRDPGIIARVRSTELRQIVHVAVPMQGVLIAAYEPRTIVGPLLLRPRVTDASTITNTALRPGGVYIAISRRKTAPGAQIYKSGVALSGTERKRYLRLPDIPDRTRRLALQITAKERDDRGRALALRAYLQDKFVYRLHVTPPPARVDAVDYFLFSMDGAYCDYFSSALAVMARINGIPSRVVTGFSSEEEDPDNGWWVVREKHAHSWVEVFLGGYGWFELDPSPAPSKRLSLAERAQKAVGAALQAARRGALAPIRALLAVRGWWWKLPAALVGLTLVAFGIRYLRRDKPPLLSRRADADELRRYVRRCYDEMCRWLRALGLPKSPGATASEYAEILERALGEYSRPLLDVIRAYLAAEYSGHPLTRADADGLAGRLQAFLDARKSLPRGAREQCQEKGAPL